MPKPPSKLPARLIIIFSSVFLAALLAHFAGVALMRYYVEETLHPALPQGTRIGEVHLNLFSGALRVEDFQLQNEGELRMRLGRLDLDISPWRLLTGELHVNRVELRNGYLRMDRRADGSYDLGIPEFGDAGPPEQDAEPAAFSLDGASLSRLTIEYHDREFASNVYLDQLTLGAYSARAHSQQVPLSWQMSWDSRKVGGDATLTIDQDQIGAQGSLQTDLLDLSRAQRMAVLEPLVDGEAAYQGDFAWQAPTLTLSGALQAPRLAYEVGGRRISLTGLNYPDFELKLLTAPKLAVELSPRKGSRVARVQWHTEDQQATADKVGLVGQWRYQDGELVNVEGLHFNADKLSWQSGTQRVGLADFRLSGALQQGISGELGLPSLNLQLSAGRVEFADDGPALALELVDLKLRDFSLTAAEGGNGRRKLGGQLSIAASRMGQADTVLHWSALAASLQGTVGLTEARIATDLSLDGLKLDDPALASGPLRIDRITSEGLKLGEHSEFQRVQLQGIRLPGELPDTGVTVAALDLVNGSYSAQKGIDLGEIIIDGLQTAVIRDKSGAWRHPGSAIRLQGPQSDSETQQKTENAQAAAWRVGGLKVTGESYITTGDQTNPAAAPLRHKIDVLAFGELTSAGPDKDTPFEIGMHPEKYTSFRIKGKGRPLADPIYLDAEGELAGLGLPRLNGYIANDLGHKFLDGQLDTRFDVKIANNKLKMGNFIELHGADAEALEGKDGPPLTTAIALLEDRDGYVKLEVPVEGKLDDPNFRVMAALNPIIMKAVAGTAALAIQPLGSVLLVGGLLADQALKVTFNPALFAAGSSELDPATKKYLGQLSGKLKERPKLALRVCGVVVDAERKKDKKGVYLDQKDALLAMAQQRADRVRAYMTQQGAGKRQLRSCRPSLDAKANAQPRVDIRL